MGRKQLGQRQGRAETSSVYQPPALAFRSQAMVISCKGAETWGSESPKPVIDARAHTHTRTHTRSVPVAVAGACQERLSSLEGDHISLNRVESEQEDTGFHSVMSSTNV